MVTTGFTSIGRSISLLSQVGGSIIPPVSKTATTAKKHKILKKPAPLPPEIINRLQNKVLEAQQNLCNNGMRFTSAQQNKRRLSAMQMSLGAQVKLEQQSNLNVTNNLKASTVPNLDPLTKRIIQPLRLSVSNTTTPVISQQPKNQVKPQTLPRWTALILPSSFKNGVQKHTVDILESFDQYDYKREYYVNRLQSFY